MLDIRSLCVCASGLSLCASAFAGLNFTLSPIVLEGDPAIGTPDAFQTFDRPNISEGGSVAFTANTDGISDENDVVYLDDSLIAWEGTSAPDTNATYASFEFFETSHQVNAAGDGVFIATLRDTTLDRNRALYKFAGSTRGAGGASLVFREGDAAPGLPGATLADFGFAGVADDGRIGFRAELGGASSGTDSAIYFAGMPQYREGDPVPAIPGLPPGARWDSNFDEIEWNGAGDFIFEGNTDAGGTDYLVRNRNGVEDVVAFDGMTVPTRNGTDTLGLILQSALAENGQWGLRGNLDAAPSNENAYIITETGFTAQEGELIDSLAPAVTGNFNGIDINSQGDVLYLADIEGAADSSVDEGLFYNGALLVHTGQQVDGLPAGTFFSDIGFEDMYINDNLEVVFQASYTGAMSGDGLFRIVIPSPGTAAAFAGGLGLAAARRRRST